MSLNGISATLFIQLAMVLLLLLLTYQIHVNEQWIDIGEYTCVHMCFRVPFSTKFKMISNILSCLYLSMMYVVCVVYCIVYACQWLRVIKHQYADKQNITSKDIKVTDFLVSRFLCDLISFGWLACYLFCCCDDGDKILMEMCRWMCVLCAMCVCVQCSCSCTNTNLKTNIKCTNECIADQPMNAIFRAQWNVPFNKNAEYYPS